MISETPSIRTLCVDLGKTSCRIAVVDDSDAIASVDGTGLPGLGAPHAATAVLERILDLVGDLHSPGSREWAGVGVGVAGALSTPAVAADLARRLAETFGAPAAVASDVITAHVGAFDGQYGVCVIAGTGAVAYGVGDGVSALVDGWGPELGDFGGGSWIGREAVRAVLQRRAGMAPSTRLVEDLQDAMHPEIDPVRWLAGPPVARRLAVLAPTVLLRAAEGDEVAVYIRDRAIRHLIRSARAAANSVGQRQVAFLGGLTSDAEFSSTLIDAARRAELHPVAPVANALIGARTIALRHDLPHEEKIQRAQPSQPREARHPDGRAGTPDD